MAVIPPYLTQGDTVVIIATARKTSVAELEPVITLIKSWGLNVSTGKYLFSAHHQFSGTDDERAADLQWALDEPEAKAILIVRGGYGTLRIIDRVNFDRFRERPKWVVGFSDVTVLHSHLFRLGFCSLHATMPLNFFRSGEATLSIKKLLFNEAVAYHVQPHPFNRPGTCSGELVGGNLSLLYALSGSASDMNYDGKVLFIEDLDEYLYHIDRMLLQLRRCGKLKNLAGLIIGGMSDMRDNEVPFGQTAEEIIRDAVSEYSYPVCFDFPAGHIDNNQAFYHGRKISLSVTDEAIDIQYLPA